MAGRGRGSGLSLTQEQLQALGVTRGDNSAPTLTPPPTFPKLETKPLPLQTDAGVDYMLIVKQQFQDHLSESAAFVSTQTKNVDVERYSDKYKILSQDNKSTVSVKCIWNLIPSELRPSHMRKTNNTRKRKLVTKTDIDARLTDLEKRETVKPSGNLESEVKRTEEVEEEEVEDEDEEMDEGTDYVDNYFDNGEAFDDEDDNLDDGPVY